MKGEDEVYFWPDPDVRTERWRYMTLRECRKALAEPVSEYDSRARLKKGFKINETTLVQKLKSLLTEMVELENSTMSTVEQLARRSLITWLEFGMHRCRIRVLGLPKEYPAAEKAQKVATGSLKFTVTPGLGIWGKVDGLGLENFNQLQSAQGA